MTSATIREARDTGHSDRYWMIVFAAVLLFVVGFFNVIEGTAAIAKSSVFIGNARYVIGDLRTWGWVALILGALQVLAGLGVLVGNQVAGWFAVAGVVYLAFGFETRGRSFEAIDAHLEAERTARVGGRRASSQAAE